MRIRSTLTGLAVAAGVLLLGAPAVLAQSTQPSTPTSMSTTSPAPADGRLTVPTVAPTKTRAPEKPQVVKPRGAAETGGGGTADSTGLYAIGGAALALTGAAGALGYRRLRKQS